MDVCLRGHDSSIISRAVTIQATPAAADHSSRARVGAGTVALNIGAFLAAFVLVCAVIGMPVSVAEVPGIGPKYRFFAEHKDEYNLLFLGSSRVFHHFLPKQFDAQVLDQSGVRLNSFNFGYDGMWPPESLYTLRQVLALKPANLRWVLIDLVQINPKIDEENMGTVRVEYWHDWQHTLMAWTALRNERLSFWEKADTALAHANYLVKRWTNIGRSSSWLDQWLRVPNKKRPKPPKWVSTNGYEAGLDRVMTGKELAQYEKQVSDFRQVPVVEIRPEMRQAINEISAEIRAAGAEPIFVLAPTQDRRENIKALPVDTGYFSFADPAKYPALYDAANRYDGWHLNEEGARVFTTHLAETFSGALKETRSPGSPAQASK